MTYLKVSTPLLIIIISSTFLIIMLYFFIKNIIRKNNIIKILKEEENNEYFPYKLIVTRNKGYDYVLRGIKDIYIKVVFVPKHSQICINAKETWKLSWSFLKNDLGKAYDNNRYMDELVNFLKSDITTDKDYLKVVFVYKEMESIIRYLNETELENVDRSKIVYGYKIFTYNTFKEDLKNI